MVYRQASEQTDGRRVFADASLANHGKALSPCSRLDSSQRASSIFVLLLC